LPIPFGPGGMAMMWQAESGMNFRMASGLTGAQPIAVRRWPVLNAIGGSRDLPEPELQLKWFIANLGITAIVADASDERLAQWKQLLSSLNLTPLEVSGVLLYRIAPDTLASYRSVSAIAAEQRAERVRFEMLVSATDRYVERGGDLAKLNVPTLEETGLLPSDWKFDPRPTAYRDVWVGRLGDKIGIGVIGSAAGLGPTIDRYGAEAAKIYYPYPREWPSETARSGWFDDLLKPAIWSPISGDGEYLQLMVMDFDPPHLRELAARVSSQPSLSLADAPRAAAR
jgi:hypothetical protein